VLVHLCNSHRTHTHSGDWVTREFTWRLVWGGSHARSLDDAVAAIYDDSHWACPMERLNACRMSHSTCLPRTRAADASLGGPHERQMLRCCPCVK
jgi:hypothetical protein